MTDNKSMFNEAENHEKLQRGILLIKSVALLLSVIIALLGATVAWFTSVSEVSATGLSVKAQQPDTSDFTLAPGTGNANVTFPCAVKMLSFHPTSSYISDSSVISENELKSAGSSVLIVSYKVTNGSSQTKNFTFTVTPPEGKDYIRMKCLGTSSTPISAEDLKDFINAEIQENNDVSSGYSDLKSIVYSVSNITGGASKTVYVALYADYDSPFSYTENSNTVNTTFGEALKLGKISSDYLTVPLSVRAD